MNSMKFWPEHSRHQQFMDSPQESSTPAASKIRKTLTLRGLWIQTSFWSWYTIGTLARRSAQKVLPSKN
jgi:hypothetical protein